jgi:hypothetical protein
LGRFGRMGNQVPPVPVYIILGAAAKVSAH